jgi:hypothetical protein
MNPSELPQMRNFNLAKKRIIALAKKRGIKIHHNDTSKSKPLSEICGKIKAKHPYTTEELMPWR